MLRRAQRMRWQQTMFCAWLLLIAFVPQLVMKATHFHHCSHRTSAAVEHTHDDHTCEHTHAAAVSDHSTTATAAWHDAGDSGHGEDCGEHCLLCHHPALWGITCSPLALAYDQPLLTLRHLLPLQERVVRVFVCANGLRGPPLA